MANPLTMIEVLVWTVFNLILLTVLASVLGIDLKAFADHAVEFSLLLMITSFLQTGFRRLMFGGRR